jgi:hypothetical protein
MRRTPSWLTLSWHKRWAVLYINEAGMLTIHIGKLILELAY